MLTLHFFRVRIYAIILQVRSYDMSAHFFNEIIIISVLVLGLIIRVIGHVNNEDFAVS